MTEPAFDTLESFKDWLLSSDGLNIAGRMPVSGIIHTRDGLTAITVYRRNNFQVEILYGFGRQRYINLSDTLIEQYVVFMGGELSAVTPLWEGSFVKEEASQDDNLFEMPHPSQGISLEITQGSNSSFSFGEEGGFLLCITKYNDVALKTCIDNIVLDSKH